MVCHQPHVPAASAVPTVGAAFGYVGLTTERHCSCAAVAGFHMKLALVNEHSQPPGTPARLLDQPDRPLWSSSRCPACTDRARKDRKHNPGRRCTRGRERSAARAADG